MKRFMAEPFFARYAKNSPAKETRNICPTRFCGVYSGTDGLGLYSAAARHSRVKMFHLQKHPCYHELPSEMDNDILCMKLFSN